MSTNPNPALDWATKRPPGSFVDVGAYHGSPESHGLLELGWSGVLIDASPDVAAAASLILQRFPGRLTAFVAAVHGTARKLVPMTWTPGEPYSGVDQGATGPARQTVAIAVPGVHPSEMTELWPVLPEPRFLIVDIGPGSLELLQLLVDWVPVGAIRVTVAREDAPRAAEWLSSWRALDAQERDFGGRVVVDITCERATALETVLAEPAPIPVMPPEIPPPAVAPVAPGVIEEPLPPPTLLPAVSVDEPHPPRGRM